MGYSTRYKMAVLDLDGKKGKDGAFETLLANAKKFAGMSADELDNFKPEYVAALQEASKSVAKVPAEAWECIGYDDDMKWYEHEEHMKLLSKAFPQFIFQLNGEGEEAGDIWVKWFHKGKMQGGKAKVVLPEFNLKAFK